MFLLPADLRIRTRRMQLATAASRSLLAAHCAAFLLTFSACADSQPAKQTGSESGTLGSYTVATGESAQASGMGAQTAMTTAQLSGLPLLQSTSMKYLGAFRLPADWPLGTSTFQYGGKAVATHKDPTTGRLTLFMQGHNHFDGHVAQIEVPDRFVIGNDWEQLPVAKVLQPFSDATDGELARSPNSTGTYSNGAPVYGLMAYNNRLIVAASHYYNQTQLTSHGVSSLNLQESKDFKGFFGFSSSVAAPPRALGGSMSMIPSEWQQALGGPALTGNQTIPMTGSNSFGPAVTVFDPNDVGVKTPIPGQTLLWYPGTNPLCGSFPCEATDNPLFNLTSFIVGRAFVPKTRSILFIGSQGVGGYWYGGQNDGPNGLRDPYFPTTGPHAPAYRYKVWAYDVMDLIDVRSGRRKPWEPRPYAMWELLDVSAVDPTGGINGAGFDPESGMLFITTNYTNRPRVEVYKITAP